MLFLALSFFISVIDLKILLLQLWYIFRFPWPSWNIVTGGGKVIKLLLWQKKFKLRYFHGISSFQYGGHFNSSYATFFLTSFLLLLPLVPVWKLSYNVAPFLSVLLWWPIQIQSNTRRNVKVVNSNRTFNNWGFSPGLSRNFLPQTHLYTPLCPDNPLHTTRTGRDFQLRCLPAHKID